MRAGSPFQDYALRKAVAQVVDYDTIVAGVLHNEGVPGAGIIGQSFQRFPALVRKGR
jgi:hypothetical protein